MEKYSVLMSLYIKENPEFLRLAINSMINQTIKPNEIVIVEDGKLNDELYKTIAHFANNYPNLINIIKNETNLGLGLSLNKGLLACKNELIARMDTDDISLPNRCEKQLIEFEKDRQLSIVGGQIEEFENCESNIIGKRIVPLTHNDISKFIKKRCPFNHMTVMFRKSSVISCGNYINWFWNEDYFLWIRMFQNKEKMKNLPDVLVKMRGGIDMYGRRGGIKYFKSEFLLQKYMYKQKNISLLRFLINVGKRFLVELVLTPKLRQYAYKIFVRK